MGCRRGRDPLTSVALAVYGVFVELRFLLGDEAFEAEVPALPAEWDGARVVLLTDT